MPAVAGSTAAVISSFTFTLGSAFWLLVQSMTERSATPPQSKAAPKRFSKLAPVKPGGRVTVTLNSPAEKEPVRLIASTK